MAVYQSPSQAASEASPSSGACAVHPAAGILKTLTPRPASKALVMPPKAPSLLSLSVPGVTTPALPRPGPSATAADPAARCCLPEALGPFLLDLSRGRPAQGPRVLAPLVALGAPTAISAEQPRAGQSPSHFSRPRLSCGVLPGSGSPGRQCSRYPPILTFLQPTLHVPCASHPSLHGALPAPGHVTGPPLCFCHAPSYALMRTSRCAVVTHVDDTHFTAK